MLLEPHPVSGDPSGTQNAWLCPGGRVWAPPVSPPPIGLLRCFTLLLMWKGALPSGLAESLMWHRTTSCLRLGDPA